MKEREPRIEADLEVAVRRPNEAHLRAGRVKNLSGGGLLLIDAESFQPGDAVAVEIPATADRGRVLVLGEVAWSEAEKKGLRFQGMLPHHRDRYRELLGTLAA